MKNIEELLQTMASEKKLLLCVGKDFWHTQDVERLNIPYTVLTDGPHGLRKQAGAGDQLGLGESVKAVCFPAGCSLAASFDPAVTEKVGVEIGRLAKQEQVGVVLGPSMNIKRSPLCGRNFEYYSEDPLLSGRMASRADHARDLSACL